MAIAIGEIKAGFLADGKGNGTLVPLPPQNGGLGWGQVWLTYGSDFGDVTLRVAIYNGNSRAWRVAEIKVPSAGGRVGVAIQDGDQKASIGRVKNDPTDTGIWPCSWLLETTLRA